MNKLYLRISCVLFCFISLNCCTHELVNLDDAKKAVINYHDSGRYDEDIKKAVEEAKEKFDKITFHDSMAVVFDIDETVLSNYEINKKLDFGYVEEIWKKWIDDAKAPAIEPVKEFYNYLLKKGSRIIFLTGRKITEYEPTRKNLVAAGYTTFDTLITRKKNEYDLDAINYKPARRIELTNKGYKIMGTVGDQWSDLNGEYHGIQLKLPNYIYHIE